MYTHAYTYSLSFHTISNPLLLSSKVENFFWLLFLEQSDLQHPDADGVQAAIPYVAGMNNLNQ